MTQTASAKPRVRLIQITDPHLFSGRDQRLLNVDTDDSLQGVIRHIEANQPIIDLLLATGDIAQDGSLDAYRRFIDLCSGIDAPLLGLPGNHDQRENFKAVWGARAQPVADIGQWRIVLLDSTVPESNAGHLAPDQLQLLEQAIEQAPERSVLVAVHHNPVPVGSPWLDTMRIDNGDELLALLENRPQVKGLVWGHIHQEFDSIRTFGRGAADKAATAHDESGPGHGLRLMATPATCVQFKPSSEQFALDTLDPGYRWLDLYDDGTLKTGVQRVPNLGLQPDAQSKGY